MKLPGLLLLAVFVLLLEAIVSSLPVSGKGGQAWSTGSETETVLFHDVPFGQRTKLRHMDISWKAKTAAIQEVFEEFEKKHKDQQVWQAGPGGHNVVMADKWRLDQQGTFQHNNKNFANLQIQAGGTSTDKEWKSEIQKMRGKGLSTSVTTVHVPVGEPFQISDIKRACMTCITKSETAIRMEHANGSVQSASTSPIAQSSSSNTKTISSTGASKPRRRGRRSTGY